MKTKYFTLIFLGMLFYMPKKETSSICVSGLYEHAQDTLPKHEKTTPDIVRRSVWDKNTALLAQYKMKKGQTVSFYVLNKLRHRKIKEVCYLNSFAGISCLPEIYDKIVIHHTAFEYQGSPFAQAKFICEGQILDKSYRFSDIAYHFVIANDGTILEGRPLSHMGTHAGKVLEKGYRSDPDFGAIGIVLLGNFDKIEPYPCQTESLLSLLSYLKEEYTVPYEGILYHNEVAGYLKTLNLTPVSKKKKCPGDKFMTKEELIQRLRKADYSCRLFLFRYFVCKNPSML